MYQQAVAHSSISNPTVNHYSHSSNKIHMFTQADANLLLRATCSIGQFGYTAQEISTHSLRAGAAMALYKANCSVPQIMQLGRWKSASFLDYIRPAIIEWSVNLSCQMSSSHHYTTQLQPPIPDTPHQQDQTDFYLPFHGSKTTINPMPTFVL